MIWADQTLQEGLRMGMGKKNVKPLLQRIRKLPVGVVDVGVADWQKYGLSLKSSSEKMWLRGRVKGTVKEVQLAHKIGFEQIIVLLRPEPGKGLMSQVYTALKTAHKFGMNISLFVENASRCSVGEIVNLWREVPIQIQSLIYGDGDSLLDPLSTARIVTSLVERIPVSLEFHSHNAYGLATANSLAALQTGAKKTAAAVAGVGVQGHAAVEELIMARKRLFREATGDTKQLSLICSQIVSLLGLDLPRTKAIIGQDIFAHESGIHVDGVVKNPQLYEAFSPEEVGLLRKLVMGKHSGTASVRAKFSQWRIALSDIEAQKIVKQVRGLSVRQKKQVDDEDLWQLYQGKG
jgi:homocitrate synthase NifV